MLKSDTSQHSTSSHSHSHAQRLTGEKTTRPRQRTSTSCMECRRRKQKCNQAKPTCNHCNRRYPPVECCYGVPNKASRSGGNVITPEATSAEVQIGDRLSSEVLNRFGQYRDSQASNSSSSVIRRLNSHSPTPRFYEVDVDGQETSIRTPYIESTTPNSRKSVVSNQINNFCTVYPTNGHHTSSPLPRSHTDSYFGVLPAHIGISPTEPYQALPLVASSRNLELLHMFVHKLSHYMTSTDGQNSSTAFNNQWVPFMIQSPIFVNIALLTAAYFQAVAKGDDVEKSVDVIGARIKLISKINGQLTSGNKAVTEEAIAAVMSLAYNELIYADKRSSLAHMKGLKVMICVYGGLDSIQFEPLRKMLIRTDYQVACAFECPPFLDEEDLADPLPPLTSYFLFLDSPLLESDIPFIDSAAELGLGPECAAILDDMRFLTMSILRLTTTMTHSSPNDKSSSNLSKFLTTTAWIHDRLDASSPKSTNSSNSPPRRPADPFLPPIRTASLIYSLSLSTRTPLSQACTPALLQRLWSQMWLIPLAKWKTIPAIFHWLVLTVMPYARDKPEGRFLKGMVAAGMMAIGLVDWVVAKQIMMGMRRVQGWLEAGRRKEAVGKKESVKEKAKVVVTREESEDDVVVEVLEVDVEGGKPERKRMGDMLEVPGMDRDEEEEGMESVSPRHRTPENVVKV